MTNAKAPNAAAQLIYTSSDLAHQHVQLQERIQAEPGFTWGIPDVDRHVLPMRGGDVALLVARPGHGKSTVMSYLALTEAMRIMERGKQDEETVVYVTWEGTVDDIYAGMVAARGQSYSSTDYWWGRVDIDIVRANVIHHGILPITMVGFSTMRQSKAKLTVEMLLDVLTAIETGSGTPKRKVKLLCCDYLQLIPVASASDRTDNVSQAIVGVKGLGIQFDIPAVLAAQASREVDRYRIKLPQESDVQWSCLTGSTVIVNAETGVPSTARDVWSLVSNGGKFPVHSMDSNMRTAVSSITAAKKNDPTPAYRLSCEMGTSICATDNHRFFTPTGWKTMSQLSAGNWVATSSSMPIDCTVSDISDDVAMFLGLLFGDGMLKRKMILFTNSDPALLDLFTGIVEREWPDMTTSKKKQSKWDTYDLTVVRKDGRHYPGCNVVLTWLKSIGVVGQYAQTKSVPEIALNDRAVCSMLAGLFATDGSVYMDAYDNARISFSTASETLARQVKGLLLRLGICSAIRTITRKSPMYIVYVAACDVLRFAEMIDLPSKKGGLLAEWLSRRIDNIERVCYGDLLPEEWNMDAINIIKMFKLRGEYNNVKGRTITRDRMMQIAGITHDSTLEMYANCDIRWVRILSIDRIEDEETFDFTVPGDECLVADGFIVHNSMGEQHTDKLFGLWIPWKTEEHGEENARVTTIDLYGTQLAITPRMLIMEMRKQRKEEPRHVWVMYFAPELLRLASMELGIDREDLG